MGHPSLIPGFFLTDPGLSWCQRGQPGPAIWALQPLCFPTFLSGQICAPGAQQPLNFPEGLRHFWCVPGGLTVPNFVQAPGGWPHQEPTDPSGDSLGRGQTRAQAGSVRVGRWEMRAPAGGLRGGGGQRLEGRVSVVLAGPWEATGLLPGGAELGRQTPGRIKEGR